jgi:hypothetical protein
VPAFYQFPMDENSWDVGRFDDIWSGVLLKRAADLVGGQIYNGAPLCEHNKAPRSTFDDLANEVAGLELNEHFWEEVDAVDPDVADGEDAYAAIARAVGERLVAGDFGDYNNGAFLNECGEYLLDWVNCCVALTDETVSVPADD